MSFASEPIQLPIVPLSLFSPHSLHTAAARKRGADCGADRSATAVRRRAAHRRSRSVSLPSSTGSVPSRPLSPSALPPRAVLRVVSARPLIMVPKLLHEVSKHPLCT